MRWIRKKWQDKPEWIQKVKVSVEELWAVYKNKDLREPEKIKQREAKEEVERQREPEGLDAYLDKDILSDEDVVINTTTDELSEW